MRRIFLFSIVAAAALAVGMGMGVGPVAAQDATNETNATAGNETVAEFDEDLAITDYELEDGEARITFEVERSRTVTITDAMDGVGVEGVVNPHSREYELERGERTISMDVREIRGASTVGVSAGGTTARLSSQFKKPEPDDPFGYFGGISGLFTGIFMTTGLAGTAAAYVVYREDSGVIKA